jgi:hypothetical protein
MKTSSITLKSSRTSSDFKVTKLVNNMRFAVGATVKEAEVKRLINNVPNLKVIIV